MTIMPAGACRLVPRASARGLRRARRTERKPTVGRPPARGEPAVAMHVHHVPVSVPGETTRVLAPRSSGKEDHLKNVKPFVETLRVTNPVRQSRASPPLAEKRVLRGGG